MVGYVLVVVVVVVLLAATGGGNAAKHPANMPRRSILGLFTAVVVQC